MWSIYSLFPDASYLVSIQPEELSYRLLPLFRNLPWSTRLGAQGCACYAALLYDAPIRARVISAIMGAADLAAGFSAGLDFASCAIAGGQDSAANSAAASAEFLMERT